MTGIKEEYREKIINMINDIENEDYLIRIYSFTKFKYDSTKNDRKGKVGR